MAKLHELQEKRRNIAAQMRQLNDEIGEKTWSDEQRTKWESMKHELSGVESQIEREESLRSTDALFVEEQRQVEAEAKPVIDVKRSQAFNSFLRRGLGELTQEEADGRIITWATANGTAEEGELIGENAAATEQDTEFGTAELGAKKLSSKIIRVSNELLQDSGVDIESYLSRRIAERIGRAEAKYLIQGTGVGSPAQPKGLQTSVTGTTQAAAAAVSWQDFNALIHSVDPAYRNTGTTRLAFNDNTLKTLKEMVDGQKRPLWLPDVAGVAPATILGQQYVIDQGIDDIGASKKFAYFGDFNRFIIRRVSGMTLRRLVERYAEFDQVGFLAFHRFDCVLEDVSAIKALTGK